ncbi:hypothetical protein ACJRO7_029998 [Eucalyptus globulus]|uniref:RRM domain-containing protein n=1 Tax=Eucalyptus globulus TaxID=34317 RepID=A0ABD3JCT0_EUCGL
MASRPSLSAPLVLRSSRLRTSSAAVAPCRLAFLLLLLLLLRLLRRLRPRIPVLLLPAARARSSTSARIIPSMVSSIVISCSPLYSTGLSFRTTEESLRNAFKNFGQLVEVNLVMDKIANRPRGFAFLRYATEEEAQRAIEGMHGKFLDGRVIFVEVAKPRLELRQIQRQNPR